MATMQCCGIKLLCGKVDWYHFDKVPSLCIKEEIQSQLTEGGESEQLSIIAFLTDIFLTVSNMP